MAICFITTCSKNKLPGGKGYDEYPAHTLPSQSTFHTRNEIRIRLLKSEIPGDLRGGTLGPDFGGYSSGLFLEAYVRYGSGSFISGLMKALDRDEDSVRHWLSIHSLYFISGLYGLVEAREPIQNYDLQLANSKRFWNPTLLAQSLLGCLDKTDCELVLDCCANLEYSNMIDWPSVERKYPVLHAVSDRFEFGQVRSAAGELAASADGKLELELIRQGKLRYMTDADIRFVQTRTYIQVQTQQPREPRIHRHKVAVIALQEDEFENFDTSVGRPLARFFEFVRIATREDLASAKARGCLQCICRIAQPQHKGYQILFGSKNIETAIREARLDPIIILGGYSGLGLRFTKE